MQQIRKPITNAQEFRLSMVRVKLREEHGSI